MARRPDTVAAGRRAWPQNGGARYKATWAKWSNANCHAFCCNVLEKKGGTLIGAAHPCYKRDKKAGAICCHSTDIRGSEDIIAYWFGKSGMRPV